MSTKLTWPAAERNKAPLLEVLSRVLPATGTVLEVASGTGQHATYFAAHLPGVNWQPTDIDAANLDSISGWVTEAKLDNLRAPLRLDVCESDWPVADVSAIFNANMIHISPWECTLGLLRGAGRYLAGPGPLVLYGPFRVAGAHTAPSNQRFDEDLRQRDPRFGVRDLEAVVEVATEQGFALEERVEMPANNQTLVFRR